MNDSTWTLREMLVRDMGPAYAPFFRDPAAAAACCAAGSGARLRLALGGRSSEKAGGPVEAEVEVLQAGEKRFRVTGPLKTGTEVSLGPSALVRAGQVTVSLVSANYSAIDLDCFIQFGLSPEISATSCCARRRISASLRAALFGHRHRGHARLGPPPTSPSCPTNTSRPTPSRSAGNRRRGPEAGTGVVSYR